jgi:tetratricopeptide (TPR) repeat protein
MTESKRGFRLPEGFKVEFDPAHLESALSKVREHARDWVDQARYTHVRFSYRGRSLGPDVPLAWVLAGEGVAFWLTGGLATLLVNVGAKAVLDVQFVHLVDEAVRRGLLAYLDGDLSEAESAYRQALEWKPEDPAANYNLGVLLRITGRREEALRRLRAAAMGPEDHPDVARAAEALRKLEGGGRSL